MHFHADEFEIYRSEKRLAPITRAQTAGAVGFLTFIVAVGLWLGAFHFTG